MITKTKVFFLDAKRKKPLVASLSPVLKPFCLCSWLAEELKLHLLELSCTECKVTRCDLVTEALTNLADTKWNLLTGCTLNILEVYKNTLRSLRTKIYCILSILCYALESLEHKVEFSDSCEIVLAAGWTWNAVLFDEVLHLLV